MCFLKKFYFNILQYEFINKFNYSNINKLPKLKAIYLTFDFKKYELKTLVDNLMALELLSSVNGFLIPSKVSKISLKVRKGTPVGCKVILRKKKLLSFLYKLLNTVSMINLNKSSISIQKKKGFKFSFRISNVLLFSELEENYSFFKKISGLNVVFITNSGSKKEIIYLLNSYKIRLSS